MHMHSIGIVAAVLKRMPQILRSEAEIVEPALVMAAQRDIEREPQLIKEAGDYLVRVNDNWFDFEKTVIWIARDVFGLRHLFRQPCRLDPRNLLRNCKGS